MTSLIQTRATHIAVMASALFVCLVAGKALDLAKEPLATSTARCYVGVWPLVASNDTWPPMLGTAEVAFNVLASEPKVGEFRLLVAELVVGPIRTPSGERLTGDAYDYAASNALRTLRQFVEVLLVVSDAEVQPAVFSPVSKDLRASWLVKPMSAGKHSVLVKARLASLLESGDQGFEFPNAGEATLLVPPSSRSGLEISYSVFTAFAALVAAVAAIVANLEKIRSVLAGLRTEKKQARFRGGQPSVTHYRRR